MGKKISAQELGWLSPAPHWSGLSGFGVKKPYSLHIPSCSHTSPAVEMLKSFWSGQGDPGVDQVKLFGPIRNAAVSVCPEWGLVRKWSGSVRSWSPREDVWQVALRKNTKSGSSMWQLCIGRWWLRTGTELPSTRLTKAVMRVASTCGVSGRCKKKGMFSAWCLLCPWAAQAEQ